MLFEVVQGTHYGRKDPKTGIRRKYVKGELVESNVDLAKIFHGKFARRGDAEQTLSDPFAGRTPAVPTTTPEPAPAPATTTVEPATTPEPAPAPATTTVEPATTVEPSPVETETVESSLGEDVSEAYPEARQSGMRVFRRGGWYYVADQGDTETALNDKALKKDDVASWIENFGGGEADE